MVERSATKTKTRLRKTMTTSIAAMIVIATIVAAPTITNKLAYAATTAAANTTAAPTAGPTMMKLTAPGSQVVIPLVKGLYDKKDILFITTEASDKSIKNMIGNYTGFPVNYEPNLTKSQDIGNIWIFKNGVKGPGFLGYQASVVDSIPGDPGYTPLWKVSIVEWKTGKGITPTVLGSDDAIAAAASKGQITITPTKVVLNEPILQWGGNKDNTIPPGHI
jgi:hypothetical protein